MIPPTQVVVGNTAVSLGTRSLASSFLLQDSIAVLLQRISILDGEIILAYANLARY